MLYNDCVFEDCIPRGRFLEPYFGAINYAWIVCIIGVCTDTYVIYQIVLEKKTYFFQMAPVTSILNQFSQTAENLLFPMMYNLWESMMIYLWITN